MPKKRSYGFVFSQFRSRTQIAQAIAHELGHGLFRLEHSFETYPSLSKGSTDNLMDYSTGNRLHKYQWDLIHNPIAMLGWFQDEEESTLKKIISNEGIRELIEIIRKANIKKERRADINMFANSSGASFNFKLGDYEFSYIGLEIKNNINPTSPQANLPIRPSQNLKSIYKKPGSNDELFMYEFYLLNEKNGSFDPNAMLEGVTALKIYVEKEEHLDFESYVYNIDRPKPGDPLIEMSIVHNYSAPTSGGMFGCARVGTGCLSSNIPNLPSYDTNEAVHAGIDVYATLNTDIFAMYSGTVEKVVEGIPSGTLGTQGAFGNRIRIKSTPEEHRLEKNITIYVYYTHLNQVKDGIKVGAKIKQGQKIGKTGNTGNAYNIPTWRYHTHINVYEGNTTGSSRVDPLNYFNTNFDSNGNIIK